jgi:hypothetical protein
MKFTVLYGETLFRPIQRHALEFIRPFQSSGKRHPLGVPQPKKRFPVGLFEMHGLPVDFHKAMQVQLVFAAGIRHGLQRALIPWREALPASEQLVLNWKRPTAPGEKRIRHSFAPAQKAGTRWLLPSGAVKTTSKSTSLNGSEYFF